MTVGNPENFKIQIKTGREEVDKRVPCDFNNLTLEKLYVWIDSHQLSAALKAELKRSAASFPHQALPSWQKNFDRYLSRAQSRLRKKKNSSTISAVVKPLEEKNLGKIVQNEISLPSSSEFGDPTGEFDEPANDSYESPNNFEDSLLKSEVVPNTDLPEELDGDAT